MHGLQCHASQPLCIPSAVVPATEIDDAQPADLHEHRHTNRDARLQEVAVAEMQQAPSAVGAALEMAQVEVEVVDEVEAQAAAEAMDAEDAEEAAEAEDAEEVAACAIDRAESAQASPCSSPPAGERRGPARVPSTSRLLLGRPPLEVLHHHLVSRKLVIGGRQLILRRLLHITPPPRQEPLHKAWVDANAHVTGQGAPLLSTISHRSTRNVKARSCLSDVVAYMHALSGHVVPATQTASQGHVTIAKINPCNASTKQTDRACCRGTAGS